MVVIQNNSLVDNECSGASCVASEDLVHNAACGGTASNPSTLPGWIRYLYPVVSSNAAQLKEDRRPTAQGNYGFAVHWNAMTTGCLYFKAIWVIQPRKKQILGIHRLPRARASGPFFWKCGGVEAGMPMHALRPGASRLYQSGAVLLAALLLAVFFCITSCAGTLCKSAERRPFTLTLELPPSAPLSNRSRGILYDISDC